MSETKSKNRTWARWVVLAAILLGVFLFTGVGLGIKPIMPEVFLPGERLSETPLFGIPGLYLTNTLIGMLGADLVVFAIAFFVYRGVKSGSVALKGVSGAVEALLEALENMTEGTAGKWTKDIFPWFATITLLVLSANWLGLLPGVETIGLLHEGHGEHSVRTVAGIQTIWDDSAEMAADAHVEDTHAEEDTHGEEMATDDHGEEHHGAAIIPFFRPVSTDLNFTFALAIVAVVMVQVIGFKALGWGYLTKFFNVKHFFSKPIFGFIDFGVGLLELVSELSKVLSFAFRLFGNLFAGAVLLFVMGSLVPFFVPAMFYMLELFVGMIQAIVFGMLTMTFMAQATQSHGDHDEAHA
ncbi:MAG: F0F1 ATP synthase subunit A [Chloroflexi bacterium]|nr:F0F1 ATP synthase subunit A [Chloroflexota bacterium]